MSGGFPIRCFTCGKLINHLYDTYLSIINNGRESTKVLDDMNIIRPCCRRMFLTHVDINQYQLQYPTYHDGVQRLDEEDTGVNDAVMPSNDYEADGTDEEEVEENEEQEDEDENELDDKDVDENGEEEENELDEEENESDAIVPILRDIRSYIDGYINDRVDDIPEKSILVVSDKIYAKKYFDMNIEDRYTVSCCTIKDYIDPNHKKLIKLIWGSRLYPIEVCTKDTSTFFALPQEAILEYKSAYMYDMIKADDESYIPSLQDFGIED